MVIISYWTEIQADSPRAGPDTIGMQAVGVCLGNRTRDVHALASRYTE
jgi:hypothetical protein